MTTVDHGKHRSSSIEDTTTIKSVDDKPVLDTESAKVRNDEVKSSSN